MLHHWQVGSSIRCFRSTPSHSGDRNFAGLPFHTSEASLRNHLLNKTNTAIVDAKDLEKKKAEFWERIYEQDYQLARALDVLKSMDILKKR